MKQTRRFLVYALMAMAAIILIGGAAPVSAKKTIIFADLGWDSVQVHNRIAGIIIEKGLGYPIKFVQGETIMLNTALIQAKGGEAPNVNLETWTENWQELYDEGLAKARMPTGIKASSTSGPISPTVCRAGTCRAMWSKAMPREASRRWRRI